MKITLQPTEKDGKQHTVTIETVHDDLTITDVAENLVIPSLIGYGFSEEVVRKIFRENDRED